MQESESQSLTETSTYSIDLRNVDPVQQPATPRDQIDDLVEELYEAHPDWPWLAAFRR